MSHEVLRLSGYGYGTLFNGTPSVHTAKFFLPGSFLFVEGIDMNLWLVSLQLNPSQGPILSSPEARSISKDWEEYHARFFSRRTPIESQSLVPLPQH